MATFSDFQEQVSSEKIGLVQVEAAKQIVDWTLVSGSIWSALFTDSSVIVAFEESSVPLTAAADQASIVAGTFFHDRVNGKIFMEAADSGDPNDKFMGATFRFFFSNVGVKQSHDLSTGFDVQWLALVKSTSPFGLQIDNKDVQLGFAIEGSGSVSFHNDQDFWIPRYDKLIFENQQVFVYSWNRELAITEAKLIYRGRIQGKTYTPDTVSFQLKDLLNRLRAPITQAELQDFTYTHDVLGSISARVTNNLLVAKQRTVYGRLGGHRPTNIDQILEDGYPIEGTVDVTNGSVTVVEDAGTDFPSQIKQGDELEFAADPGRRYSIETFIDATTITLDEAFEGTTTLATTAQVFPQRPHQAFNRFFQIAGHALTSPSTTITTVSSARIFRVANINGILEGDTVLVAGVSRTVASVEDGDKIVLNQNLPTIPSVGNTVTRSAVTNAFINQREIFEGIDFTVDATNAIIQLERTDADHPEFRLAPLQILPGTSNFAAGSRVVTGASGAGYRTEIKPGDWIFITSAAAFRQVWAVESDTTLIMTQTSPIGGGPQAISIKRPNYYAEGSDVLSADVIGRSDDGTSTGDLLRRGPEIVQRILTDGGLGSELVSSSFDTANDIAQHDLSFAIPSKFSDRKSPSLRQTINVINKSIFGTLFQDDDFLLRYDILRPDKPLDDTVDRSDILSFSVKSDSKKIIKQSIISYNFKEYDSAAAAASNQTETFISDVATNLVKTDNEFTLDTFLLDTDSARIFAGRWTLLLQLSKTTVAVNLKLQAFDYNISDKIQVIHPKFFERIGLTANRKLGLIQKITRSITSSSFTIDDLGTAFSRCAAITENDAVAFTSASDSDKMVNGYITANDGTLGGDAGTHKTSVIW